jgi:hypothetical protein
LATFEDFVQYAARLIGISSKWLSYEISMKIGLKGDLFATQDITNAKVHRFHHPEKGRACPFGSETVFGVLNLLKSHSLRRF